MIPTPQPVGPLLNAALGRGVRESDRAITTVDADGVALAAIQGVNQKLTEGLKRRDVENAELKRELAALKSAADELRACVNTQMSLPRSNPQKSPQKHRHETTHP
jgi:hypothetical protein